MKLKTGLYLGVAAIGIAILLTAPPAQLSAQTPAVAIDNDDIGGVVRSASGPEAGVWVIAETTDLPTKFAKMVVTDDQGRYVVPDLPKAKYKVWVRGYGLVDSPKVDGEPGQQLNLTAVVAPNDAAAAKYYPAIYWFAMLKIPPASEFGGSTDIPKTITRENWLRQMSNVDCIGCHQLGQEATRTIPTSLGEFKSHEDAWRAAYPVRPGRRTDDDAPRRTVRRRAVQVFRRLDAADREGRVAEEQAAAAAGRRAQPGRHLMGVGHREAIPARPDLVGSA